MIFTLATIGEVVAIRSLALVIGPVDSTESVILPILQESVHGWCEVSEPIRAAWASEASHPTRCGSSPPGRLGADSAFPGQL